nr:unnamed protein product [Digitaria exilis]
MKNERVDEGVARIRNEHLGGGDDGADALEVDDDLRDEEAALRQALVDLEMERGLCRPQAPPLARSAGRGRRLRDPPSAATVCELLRLALPPKSGLARACAASFAPSREMGRGERATHLCVSHGLRPKMGRGFGSPVGGWNGDPKTLL